MTRMVGGGEINHEWSEWDEYVALGSRRMDCIGRWESDRADREIASQRDRITIRFEVAVIDPNRPGGSGERSEPGGRDTDGQAGG